MSPFNVNKHFLKRKINLVPDLKIVIVENEEILYLQSF
jgi:hypothetical protein